MRRKLTAGVLVFIALQSMACSLTAEGGKICIVVATQTPSSLVSPEPLPPQQVPSDTPLRPPAPCADTVAASDAGSCTGEVATVCGTVADTSYREDIGGRPTYLNFCRPYPDHCFTALLWEDHRQELVDCLGAPPEDILLEKETCVTGLVEEYRGLPEIVLTSCDQLEVLP